MARLGADGVTTLRKQRVGLRPNDSERTLNIVIGNDSGRGLQPSSIFFITAPLRAAAWPSKRRGRFDAFAAVPFDQIKALLSTVDLTSRCASEPSAFEIESTTNICVKTFQRKSNVRNQISLQKKFFYRKQIALVLL